MTNHISFLASFLLFNFAAANSEIYSDTQRIFHTKLPEYISDKSSSFLKRSGKYYNEIHEQEVGSWDDAAFNLLVSNFKMAYNQLASTSLNINSISDLTSASAEFHKLRELYVELESLKPATPLKAYDSDTLCSRYVPEIFIHDFPNYQIKDSPSPCQLPKPVERHTESAENFRTQGYLPATAGGCAAGQLFILIPFLGCVIGAAAGAVIAAIGGETASAIIDSNEHDKDWAAYKQGCETDKQGKLADIQKAKQWAEDHPITVDLVRESILATCILEAKVRFPSLSNSHAEIFNNALEDASNYLDLLRQTLNQTKIELLNKQKATNKDSVDSYRQGQSDRFSHLEAQKEKLKQERSEIDSALGDLF